MSDFKKLEDENYFQYIWRLDSLIQSGKYKNWKEIVGYVNQELFGDDIDKYRDESAYRKSVKYAKDFYEAGVFTKDDDYINQLKNERLEIQKERIKLRTEKLEYNKWLREDARDEMIAEQISDAILSLKPLSIPDVIIPKENKKSFILAFGDEHYGASFELKDLFGNIINSYSPEIFESRMWDLFNQVIAIIEKENIDELNIFNMGDFSDGCLRVSQLMKLRYGVVDGTILYANFITNWLNELSKYVKINYQMTDGNHTELRELGQPKGTFTDDNMGKVVREFIKVSLANNPNFTYIENCTGYIYGEFSGSTVLGIHGDTKVKNMERLLRELSAIHNINIDYLLAGHMHHSRIEEVGINSEVINVPSIIGTDPYSLSLNKVSNASAKMIVFEQSRGKVCEYTLKLN